MATSITKQQTQMETIRCDALHIGMPKCGSTFLQHVGFAQHSGIRLIWEPGPKLFFELRDEVASDTFDLTDYANRLRAYVDSKTEGIDSGTKVVFSFEGFCGPHTTNKNDRLLAQTLLQLFGPTKVVFIVREQYKLMYSIWAQFIKEGGVIDIKDFFNHADSPTAPQSQEANIFLRVQYAAYIRSLFEIFGRENVGIYFFEDFVDNYESFMKSIYDFIGVDDSPPPNTIVWRGPNQSNARILRRLNQFTTTKHKKGPLPYSFYIWYRQKFEKYIFPSRRWNASSIFDVRKVIPPEVQDEIRQSNRELANLVDRDLSKLGYSL